MMALDVFCHFKRYIFDGLDRCDMFCSSFHDQSLKIRMIKRSLKNCLCCAMPKMSKSCLPSLKQSFINHLKPSLCWLVLLLFFFITINPQVVGCDDFAAVNQTYLIGPKGTGKSTLLKSLLQNRRNAFRLDCKSLLGSEGTRESDFIEVRIGGCFAGWIDCFVLFCVVLAELKLNTAQFISRNLKKLWDFLLHSVPSTDCLVTLRACCQWNSML